MLCRFGEGTGPKGPVNGEAPLRLRHEASFYPPPSMNGPAMSESFETWCKG